jgi:predicted dienelactone hydrolase
VSQCQLSHFSASNHLRQLNRLSSETQTELLNALDNPQQIDIAVLAQWLYEPMVERALLSSGRVIRTASGQNGQKAIRGAVLRAAAEPGGLTLINALKYFPTEGIRLDLARGLARWRELKATVDQTNTVVAEIQQLSEATAAVEEAQTDYAALPDLTQPGPFQVMSQTVILEDASRNRTFPVDVYVPENASAAPGSIPVVVISHGYGDTRTRFAEFAQQIASYGMLVIAPEHIFSDTAQKEAMKAWLDYESFKPSEFVDRPLDVSFVLDELERRNATDLQGRLNLSRVAVIGHSFGGYTALALAGATVDLPRLNQVCNVNQPLALDLAFLLACRALELSPEASLRLTDGSLRDPRVYLVMAFAPVSNLFGETGIGKIQIPTVFMGGAYDIAAPVVPEQVLTFSWLTTPDKYLYLAEGTSHGRDLTRWLSRLFNPSQEVEQSFDEAHSWFKGVLKSLIVAYPQVYLVGQERYRPYLTSGYIETISQEPFKLHMVHELPKEDLPIESTEEF